MDIDYLELATEIYGKITKAREILHAIKSNNDTALICVSMLCGGRFHLPEEINDEVKEFIIEKLENQIIQLIDKARSLQ